MTGNKNRVITAPRGNKISCKGWLQEAALRMLMNNLDPQVAEDPANLVVYGGNGQAARNWECFDAIVKSLQSLENDETLLVQSGKPVGIFKTHENAPRVLIANSNLVPKWANWEHFRELQERGLMMFGQMTAGSWIYIGTQGILQGTYETFGAAAKKHFNSFDLSGKIVLTAGLGGMGGAQPLAATMLSGVMIAIEVDQKRIEKRLETRYLDTYTDDINQAISMAQEAASQKKPLSIGLLGNASELLPKFVEMDFVPHLLTDQTSAHDELNGYVPGGYDLEKALILRKEQPAKYIEKSRKSMAIHVKAMLDLQKKGAITFDYGNNIRAQAHSAGIENAFDFPGFVPAYIRPLFCEGKGPFRWVALSGDPQDIYTTDQAILELFPENKHLKNWLEMAREKISFQGLPSRICWLGYGERALAGERFNQLVKEGKISAPIVIGRDHLDCGSVASPNRETEAMLDGTDAVADWPLLNAMLNTAGGATWVSLHHGGGVGMGYSLHAGQVIVADGTDEAQKRLRLVLTNDPGTGIMRHVDSGEPHAVKWAKEKGVNIPMMQK